MVTNSWFRNLWTTSKKHDFHEKAQIAVLAFEASSLMTKLLHLWQSLTDKQVARLREEIAKSEGVRKLVSENDDYIARLICAEMMENLAHVARAVSRLSKKCNDPLLKSFEQAFNELVKAGADTYGWQFSWKKMERKVKKMERFIVTNSNLYQEMETLADLEQTLKRIKGNDNADSITLVEYEKKVVWKQQEVKHQKENSLWNRTYDYTILLLARSTFTIYARIGHVFGIFQVSDVGVKDFSISTKILDTNTSRRSHSTVFMQSSVYPSENCHPNSASISGPLMRTKNVPNFHSGPLGKSNNNNSNSNGVRFHSGPLGRPTPPKTTTPISRASKSPFRLWNFRDKSHDSRDKTPQRKPSGMTMLAPSLSNSGTGRNLKQQIYGNSTTKSKLLNPPPETLGAAALALHYANLVIFIEKLVGAPHLIGNDARDDLYSMLPASIRGALRATLKPYTSSLSSSFYDTALAGEWNEAMLKTLEWLGPLAHNMIRWQSERSFEHQNYLVSKTNVLLVQTLYFANQEKTEAAITDLLVGLNYIWRFGREINVKSLVECNEYLE